MKLAGFKIQDKEYKAWLADIKARIRSAQIKATVSVNAELLKLYWSIGADIVVRQKNAKWGDSFLSKLSKDLMSEFPDMKGFSLSNLKYIKQWFQFYSKEAEFSQQVVGQITQIPLIFLTTSAQKKDLEKGKNAGGDGYLTKPYEGKALITEIQRLLKKT